MATVSITFTGDDLEEMHAKLMEYATAASLIDTGESAEEPEAEEPEEETAEEPGEEDTDTLEEPEEEDDESAKYKKANDAIIKKYSKTKGGPDLLRAALKKVAKTVKFGDVPAAKQKPLAAEFKKVFKIKNVFKLD